MKPIVKGLLVTLGLALASANGLASQPVGNRLSSELPDDQRQSPGGRGVPAPEALQPGDQLDLELYQRGRVSRFGIRREIVRIGNREFIIDDQDRMIIHISVY